MEFIILGVFLVFLRLTVEFTFDVVKFVSGYIYDKLDSYKLSPEQQKRNREKFDKVVIPIITTIGAGLSILLAKVYEEQHTKEELDELIKNHRIKKLKAKQDKGDN